MNGRLELGQLERSSGRWQLRFTRNLPHRPEKVWRALTEAPHLAVWFPTGIEGERAAGAKLRFVFRGGEVPATDGEMITYDPPAALEFRWGDETLLFKLKPDGEGSILTFVVAFDELGKAARDGAGWHACLDFLSYRLDGEDPPWTSRERWEHVHESYMERFGPDASTIGPPAPRA